MCRWQGMRYPLYRTLVAVAVIAAAATALGSGQPAAHGPSPEPAGVSSGDALATLRAGNARFAAGKAVHPHQTLVRRQQLVQGQKPFAVVLTCADSRVAPELYFDQGLGDLFVLRNAGNLIDDHILGSIEYAVEHLGVTLIVVVGHTKCGAVAAAVAGGEAPGHVGSILRDIAPSVAATAEAPDRADAAMRANAARMAAAIADAGPILREAVKGGHLRVVDACYDLASGQVEFSERPVAP